MKVLMSFVMLLVVGCAGGSNNGYQKWTVGKYRPMGEHTPKLDGYRQVKSEAVEFRKYKVDCPGGAWWVTLDAGEEPILVEPKRAERVMLGSDWYQEEGGADAAAVYGFVKGDETVIVIEGTSAITSEETWLWFEKGRLVDKRRYAEKGQGMGPEAPGKEPKYRIYPPL